MKLFQSIIKWCTLFSFIAQVLFPYYAFAQPSYVEQEGRLYARYEIGFTQNQALPPLLIPVTKETDTGLVSFDQEGVYQNGFIVNGHYCFESHGVKWVLTVTGDLVAVEQTQTELDQLWVNNQSGKLIINTDMQVNRLDISVKEVEQLKSLNVTTLSLSLGNDGNYVNKGDLTLSQLSFLSDTKKKHGVKFTNNGRILMTGQAKVSGKGSLYNFNELRYAPTQNFNQPQDIVFENISLFNKGNIDLAGKATLAFQKTFYNDAFIAFQEDVTLKGEFSLKNEATIRPKTLSDVMTTSQAEQPLKGIFAKADMVLQDHITFKNSGTFVIAGKSQGQLETFHNAGYFASQSIASHITLNALTNTYAGIMKLEGRMATTSFQNEGKIAAAQFSLETQQFQNVKNGYVEIDNFLIKASEHGKNHGEIKSRQLTLQMPDFENTGHLTTDVWHQKGEKFINAQDAEVNVSTLSDLQLGRVENKGAMQLALLQGNLKLLRNENTFESDFSKKREPSKQITIEEIFNGGSLQIGGQLKTNHISALAGFEKTSKKTTVEQLHILAGLSANRLEDVEVVKSLSGSVKSLSFYGTVLTASSDLTIEGYLFNYGTFQSNAGNITAKTFAVTGTFTALNGVMTVESVKGITDEPEGKTVVDTLTLVNSDSSILNNVTIQKQLSGSVKTLSFYGTVLTASSDLTIEGHLFNYGTFQSNAGNITAKNFAVTGTFTALNGMMTTERIRDIKDKPEGKTVLDTLTIINSDSCTLNNVTIQKQLSGSVKILGLYGTVLTASSDLTIEGHLFNYGTFQSNAGNITAKELSVTGTFTALNGMMTTERIRDIKDKPEGKTVLDTLTIINSDSCTLNNVTIQKQLSGSVKSLSFYGTVLTASSDLTIEGHLFNYGTFQSNAGNITAKTFSVTGHFTALNGVMTVESVKGITDEPEGKTVADTLTLVNSDSSILNNVTIQKQLTGTLKTLSFYGTVLTASSDLTIEGNLFNYGTFQSNAGNITAKTFAVTGTFTALNGVMTTERIGDIKDKPEGKTVVDTLMVVNSDSSILKNVTIQQQLSGSVKSLSFYGTVLTASSDLTIEGLLQNQGTFQSNSGPITADRIANSGTFTALNGTVKTKKVSGITGKPEGKTFIDTFEMIDDKDNNNILVNTVIQNALQGRVRELFISGMVMVQGANFDANRLTIRGMNTKFYLKSGCVSIETVKINSRTQFYVKGGFQNSTAASNLRHIAQNIINDGEILSDERITFELTKKVFDKIGNVQSNVGIDFVIEQGINGYVLLSNSSLKAPLVKITGHTFESLGDIAFVYPLELLMKNFKNSHQFKAGFLTLHTEQFSNGLNGDIKCQGDLNLFLRKNFENKGTIEVFGNVVFEYLANSTNSSRSFLNGASRQGSKISFEKDRAGSDVQYGNEFTQQNKFKTIRCGGSIKSNQHLIIRGLDVGIYNSFGTLFGRAGVDISSSLGIFNRSASILSEGDICLNGRSIDNISGDLERLTISKPWYGMWETGGWFNHEKQEQWGDYRIYADYIVSGASEIKTTRGDIYLKNARSITNRGSSILSNKGIYVNNVPLKRDSVSGNLKIPSIMRCDPQTAKYVHIFSVPSQFWKVRRPSDKNITLILEQLSANILAGQNVRLNLGALTVSGRIDAPNVQINTEAFEIYGNYTQILPNSKGFVIDIGKMAFNEEISKGLFVATPVSLVESMVIQDQQVSQQLQSLTSSDLKAPSNYDVIRIVEKGISPQTYSLVRENLQSQPSAEYRVQQDLDQALVRGAIPFIPFSHGESFSICPSSSNHALLSEFATQSSFMNMCSAQFSSLNLGGKSGDGLWHTLIQNGKLFESYLRNNHLRFTPSDEDLSKLIASFGKSFVYYKPLEIEYITASGHVFSNVVQRPFVVISQDTILEAAKKAAYNVAAQMLDVDTNTLTIDGGAMGSFTPTPLPNTSMPLVEMPEVEPQTYTNILVNEDMNAESFQIHSDGNTSIHVKGNADLKTGTYNIDQFYHQAQLLKKTSEVYGKQGVHLKVDGDQTLGHIKVESQVKIENQVGGDSIKLPERVDNKQWFVGHHSRTTIQDITQHGAQFIVEDDNGKRGTCVEEIGGNANWANVSYRVGDLDISCEKDFTLDALNDEHHYDYHYLEKDWFSRDEVTKTEGYVKSKGNIFDMETMRIVANGEVAYLKQVDIQGKLADITAKLVYFAQGTSIEYHSYSEMSKDPFYISGEGDSKAATTHVACKTNCPVRVHADKIIMEFVNEFYTKQKDDQTESSYTSAFDDTAMKAFLEQVIVDDNTQFLTVNLQNAQELSSFEISTLGPATLGIIALAAVIATAGMASYLGGYLAGASGLTVGVPAATTATSSGFLFCETAALAGANAGVVAGTTVVGLTQAGVVMTATVTAGVTTLASKVAVNLALAKGDVGKALKMTATKDTLISMACSMAGAGILQGIGTYNNIPITNTAASKFANQTIKVEKITSTIGKVLTQASQHAKTAALSAMVYGTVAIVAGADVRDTLRDGALNSVGNMVANTFAENFGISNQPELTTYVAKALVAAGTTALVAENKDKAAAAIAAAGVAVFNELMINSVAPVEETAMASLNAEMTDKTLLAQTDKDRLSAMEAVNQFSQLANRCISGMAGFQGRSQQAFELGASIPAMTHAKAVEERTSQLRKIRTQTLQAQLQEEEVQAKKTATAKAKTEEEVQKEAQHQETILALMHEGEGKGETQFVLHLKTEPLENDSPPPYISFRTNKKEGGIPKLNFAAMEAYKGPLELLSPASRSALNHYKDAFQSSLNSLGTFRFHDEGPLFDPHEEATTGYILEQNSIAQAAAERLKAGDPISAYETEVIARVQHDKANVISQAAKDAAMFVTTAVALTTSAPVAVVTAVGIGSYAIAGGISAAAHHNFDLSTAENKADVWRGTGIGALEGANLIGVIDVVEGVRNRDMNQVSDGIQRLAQDQFRVVRGAKSNLLSKNPGVGSKAADCATHQAVGQRVSTPAVHQQYKMPQQPQTLKPTNQNVKFDGVDAGRASVSGTSATKATAQSRPILTTENTVTSKVTAGKSFADALKNKGVIKGEGSFKSSKVSNKVAVPQTQNVSLQGVSYADVAKGVKKAPTTPLPISNGKVSSNLSESVRMPANTQRAGFKSYADALKAPPHHGTNIIPFPQRQVEAISSSTIAQLKATGTYGGVGFKGHTLTAHSKMSKPMTSSLGTIGKNSVKEAQQVGQGLSGKMPSCSATGTAEAAAAKSTAKGSSKGRGKGSDKCSAAKGEAKADAAAEIAEEGVGAYHTVDRFGRQRPDTRLIPDNLKSYIREVEEKSALKVSQKQLDALTNDLRNTQYPRFEKGSAGLAEHKKAYKPELREQLKAEWSRETGQPWPKYTEEVYTKDGRIWKSIGEDYDLHHIVPQNLGGHHAWWNSHPVHISDHIMKDGIHLGVLKDILKDVHK